MSLRSTLRHIQKELTQGQADSGWQPPATTGSVNNVPAGEAEPALTEQPPADAAAAAVNDDMDSSDDTNASTRYVAVSASERGCMVHPWLSAWTAVVQESCHRHENVGLMSCPRPWGLNVHIAFQGASWSVIQQSYLSVGL